VSLKARLVAGIIFAILVPLVIGTTSVINMGRMAAADQTLFYDGKVPLTLLSQSRTMLIIDSLFNRKFFSLEGYGLLQRFVTAL
jgi:hypothetical protein